MRQQKIFHFKRFSVRHDRCTMKVGTDGVLLGAWAVVTNAESILDIGTGSGVIALMAAQRTPDKAFIDAVEILEQDAAQATDNVLMSPWKEKITIHCTSVQQFYPGKKYDVIISNPPYFLDSQAPPDKKRHSARHAITLEHVELIEAAKRLLHPTGKLNVILPYTEGLNFMKLATGCDLFCTRKSSFKSKKDKPVERLLMEFSLTSAAMKTEEIILYDEYNEWSEQYRILTKEFYLRA